MHYIALATEDELSETVGLKLITQFLRGFEVHQTLRRNGNGYLRSRMSAFCKMAEREPVLLITDLDNLDCPSRLKSSWLAGIDPPENFLFRVAVREVEA